jgi:hypothetical protein
LDCWRVRRLTSSTENVEDPAVWGTRCERCSEGEAGAGHDQAGHAVRVHDCPACGFEGLGEPPWDESGNPSYDICPCCGMQFGYYDSGRREELFYAGWRVRWLVEGGRWWSKGTKPPPGWSAEAQVAKFNS